MNFARQQIVQIVKTFIGVPFIHQGRSDNGVDCVGLLVELAKRLDYPYTDLEGYKRTPSSSDLVELLRQNLDEIALSEIGLGDICLMRLGGAKPRHTAIVTNLETDLELGKVPMLCHALNSTSIKRVIEQPIELYRGQIVRGFRLKGVQ